MKLTRDVESVSAQLKLEAVLRHELQSDLVFRAAVLECLEVVRAMECLNPHSGPVGQHMKTIGLVLLAICFKRLNP